ncbi:RNA polymerase sigma-70 factor [Sabulilitoribacter arenilitoris]|uniref:RNA polymerase sigma-70 factor n=1 Tax=Wocania arenilitoris TaxID=2044858 RepID=A0AAE3ER66_9FLAO|nr:RNA polymerase sigma-70 factor [Wocania arenilitoris]MCF7568709.1 RNA polymerase sigma-70 factor [Wocania arenilitoris]
MNEIDAVKTLKRADEKAFKYLFEKYYDRLVAYIVTYTHDQMKAEDIVQQAFIDFWKDRHKLNDIKSPKNYLYAIAYNRYVDSVRKDKKRIKLLDDIWQRSLNDRIEEDNEAMEKRIKRMYLIIDSLPPRCKRIIQMNKMEGVKYKDIASILDISIKTVEAQMSIAFKKIRKGFANDNMVLFFIRSLQSVLNSIK